MTRWLTGLALLLCASLCAATPPPIPEDSPTLKAALARGELRVGLEAGYMPFEMRDKTGEIIGFDVDMARLMGRALGLRVSFVNTQWDGIIPALLTNKFDVLMSGMTITEERAQQVAFSDPYIVVGQSLLMAPKYAGKINSYEVFNDPQYVVAVKLGTTGDLTAREYLPRAQIRQFETEADAVLDMRNGRADAFVYDFPYNAVYAARNPGQVVHLAQPFTREPLGWAARKNDPAFVSWMNAFLTQTHEDGSYDALYGKWFTRSAWLGRLD